MAKTKVKSKWPKQVSAAVDEHTAHLIKENAELYQMSQGEYLREVIKVGMPKANANLHHIWLRKTQAAENERINRRVKEEA